MEAILLAPMDTVGVVTNQNLIVKWNLFISKLVMLFWWNSM